MILVDKALNDRLQSGNPLRVGIAGCGFLGRALASQILSRVPGMQLSCIATRTIEKAAKLLKDHQVSYQIVTSPREIEQAILNGDVALTDNPEWMCSASGLEVLFDACGDIEMGIKIALGCLENEKHLILINAELDATVGPILYQKAKSKGLVFTGTDGDQPGSQMNLFRFVKSIGLTPLVVGNIKGLQDHYRTPETQREFAQQWKQNPTMVTSFADGTKISFEQALVANATGFKVSKRGMIGMEFKGHIDELTKRYDHEFLLNQGGIIDYVVGPQPGPGVYVIAHEEDPDKQNYLKYFKMGEGPLYSFYTPYHLCHLEAPLSGARAALLGDEVVSPSCGPVVDVIALAKKDLKPGEILDGIGGFTCYGVCENAQVVHADKLLPIGLSDGCVVKNELQRDQPVSIHDVEFPSNRLVDDLRSEQNAFFFNEKK